MKKDKNDTKIIEQITEARKKNNYNWMAILKLAIQVAPDKAKKILNKINHQDKKISQLVKKLSKK